MIRPIAICVVVSDDLDDHVGRTVYLNDQVIGFRPYNGADDDEIADEVLAGLAELLREKFGWPKESLEPRPFA